MLNAGAMKFRLWAFYPLTHKFIYFFFFFRPGGKRQRREIPWTVPPRPFDFLP